MIAVTIGNNLDQKRFNMNPDTTIRQAVENTAGETGISLTTGVLYLGGTPVRATELDKTFAELGYTGEPNHDSAFIISVFKASNA